VVEGPALIAAAAAAGWEIERVFVAPVGPDPVVDDLRARLGAATPVAELAPGVIERVATTEAPQPALAVVRRRVSALDDLGGVGFAVVADRLADPGNAGTLLRSAEASGAGAVVFTAGSVDVFNPKVVRSSAGALFHVPVVTDVALADAVAVLRAGGCRVLGTSSHRGAPYAATDLTGPVALVVGNEAHGVPDDAPVDAWVTIPHAGRAESLNVAMATTVLCFDVARQRAAAARER
jgi:TrmH family RNA methyltransferase